jgi:hypothetical protein
MLHKLILAALVVLVVPFAGGGCALPGDDVDDVEGSAAAVEDACAADSPVCAEACVERHREFALWASPYDVEGAYGFGRHQGIAIVAVDFAFDARRPLSELPRDVAQKRAWPKTPELENLPVDVAEGMLPTGKHREHTRFPLCGRPRVSLDRPSGNHGRPLSRAPEDRQSRLRVSGGAFDATPGKRAAIDNALSCVEGIENGFCDAVCGNCSYVLPSAAIMTSDAGEWSNHADVIEVRREAGRQPEGQTSDGPGACGEESYVGGPKKKSKPDDDGDSHDNPFTHCAMFGCGSKLEAPSIKSLLLAAPMTGLYGHNSNTDAEAEFTAFEGCMRGSVSVTSACSVCGGAASRPGRQTPCDDKTNTASHFWRRTAAPIIGDSYVAGAFKDKVPAIRRGGQEGSSSPVCGWGNFPVHGM